MLEDKLHCRFGNVGDCACELVLFDLQNRSQPSIEIWQTWMIHFYFCCRFPGSFKSGDPTDTGFARSSQTFNMFRTTLLVVLVVKYLFARRAEVLAVCFVSLSRPSQGPYRKVRHQDESMPMLSSRAACAKALKLPVKRSVISSSRGLHVEAMPCAVGTADNSRRG